jgi:hypothetical protein
MPVAIAPNDPDMPIEIDEAERCCAALSLRWV